MGNPVLDAIAIVFSGLAVASFLIMTFSSTITRHPGKKYALLRGSLTAFLYALVGIFYIVLFWVASWGLPAPSSRSLAWWEPSRSSRTRSGL